MKIIALQAENIKKLVAVEIRPDGNMVQITGKNGQGKTSVLDAIWWALAGATHIQAVPIRTGENQARIRLDMGEIVVTRTFKKKDDTMTSSILVENAKGAKFPSPQEMLDNLLGELSFDPLAFARMSSKEQYETLKKFVPGVDFDKIEKENLMDYNQRTEINRRVNEAKTLAGKIVIQDDPTLPKEKIDEGALLSEMTQASKHNTDVETRRLTRENMAADSARKRKEAQAMIETANAFIMAADVIDKKLSEAEPLPSLKDADLIQSKINTARHLNAILSKMDERKSHLQKAETLAAESGVLTAKITERNEGKRQAIANAKLPVKEIGFGEGHITLNGVPFEQASDAEQLRASISIAMALNPKLKVIRVRDGSLLDEDSMKLLAEMAQEKDFQFWVERVDSTGKVGFVLEDGHIKEKEPLNA